MQASDDSNKRKRLGRRRWRLRLQPTNRANCCARGLGCGISVIPRTRFGPFGTGLADAFLERHISLFCAIGSKFTQ
jgi:hypothetical protein